MKLQKILDVPNFERYVSQIKNEIGVPCFVVVFRSSQYWSKKQMKAIQKIILELFFFYFCLKYYFNFNFKLECFPDTVLKKEITGFFRPFGLSDRIPSFMSSCRRRSKNLENTFLLKKYFKFQIINLNSFPTISKNRSFCLLVDFP